MILGIGIDSVEIHRFTVWPEYQRAQLYKVFSQHELEYAFRVPAKRLERLAARFAAKEAFFKAFSSWQTHHNLPFLTICRLIELRASEQGAPQLIVAWDQMLAQNINKSDTLIMSHISITHTQNLATAIVVLEKA